MPYRRPASWAALAAGMALVSLPADGRQQPKDDRPQKTVSSSDLSALRTAEGIPPTEMEKAKAVFKGQARFVAEYVAFLRAHTAPQEFRSDPPPKNAPPVPYTMEEVIKNSVDPVILVPVPGSSVGPGNADYIRELGVAFNTALEGLPKNPEPVIAVNGARVLANVCRSGAHAHYPTVTELIKQESLPAAAKYYAFVAAHNLLAAYDLNDYRTRRHSAPDALVGPLVAALQAAIESPTAILPPAVGTDGKPLPTLPDDQKAVLQFVRRQAIKALAQVRAHAVPLGKGTLYPSLTLARVALSDPALGVPPSPAEAAEAVIGICNMSPPRAQAAEPYAYAMTDAILTGLVTFGTPRAAKVDDKSLPWRGYGMRLNEALVTWQRLFDANYNPLQPAAAAANQAPPVVAALIKEAQGRLLEPIEGTGRFDLNGLQQYRDATLRADAKWTDAPYRDTPALRLPVRK